MNNYLSLPPLGFNALRRLLNQRPVLLTHLLPKVAELALELDEESPVSGFAVCCAQI